MSNLTMTFHEKCEMAFQTINRELSTGFPARKDYFVGVGSAESASRSKLVGDLINYACNVWAVDFEEYSKMWDVFECVFRHEARGC